MLGILILAVAFSILLFAIGFYYFSKEQKEQKEQDKTKKQKTVSGKNNKRPVETISIRVKNYIQDKFFFDIFVEIAAVFIGAMLAMACTDWYDNHQAKEASIAALEIASKDMYTQAGLLEGGIKQYQNGNIDIDTLRLNAPIDASILESIVYETNIMKTMKKGPYAMLLQIYRDIEKTNAYLVSDRLATETYIVELCDNLVEDTKFISELIEWTMERYEKNITEMEFAQWYEDFIQRFFDAKDAEYQVFTNDG